MKFYEKHQLALKTLMSNYCIRVGPYRFELIAMSIHCMNAQNPDRTVTWRPLGCGRKKWFISPNEFVKYIDIDLTNNQMEGGWRIDSIKEIGGQGREIASCGKVYDFIKSLLGSNFQKMHQKSVLSDSSLPIFLEKYVSFETCYFELPRTSGYDFKRPRGYIPYLDRHFLNLKICKTNNINHLVNITGKYKIEKNHLPLILKYYSENRLEQVLKILKIKDSVIQKYTDAFDIGVNLTQWEILEKYKEGRPSNNKMIAELSGLYIGK